MADGGSDLQCTCYRLRKATRRVTAAYDEALAPLGLTATQMSVLAVASGGRWTVSALAEALGMDVSTLSRTLGAEVAELHDLLGRLTAKL